MTLNSQYENKYLHHKTRYFQNKNNICYGGESNSRPSDHSAEPQPFELYRTYTQLCSDLKFIRSLADIKLTTDISVMENHVQKCKKHMGSRRTYLFIVYI